MKVQGGGGIFDELYMQTLLDYAMTMNEQHKGYLTNVGGMYDLLKSEAFL